jgi:perosamine synthetase
MLAYLALDLPPGSTVCCPAYGFPAAHNAARLLGHYVKLIDVLPRTGNMDAVKLTEYVRAGWPCAAVVYVDHNGHCGNGIEQAAKFCKLRGIPLIEDAATALGCRNAGMVGDISILSFSVPKIITTGQGGAVMARDEKIAELLEQLVDQGGGDWRKDRLHTAVGGNFRMTDIQAALGLAQLRDLPRTLEIRHRLWGWYREGIEIANDVRPSGWMVTVNSTDDAVMAEIVRTVTTAGYDCRRLYRPVNHCMPYAGGDYPGAEDIYKHLLYLPSSLNLTRKQVREVTDAVRRK